MFIFTQAEGSAAMAALVSEAADFAIGIAPEHQLFTESRDPDRLIPAQFAGIENAIPLVLDHPGSLHPLSLTLACRRPFVIR
jgi:hypothetical protein